MRGGNADEGFDRQRSLGHTDRHRDDQKRPTEPNKAMRQHSIILRTVKASVVVLSIDSLID
jgi:hypothetical protein